MTATFAIVAENLILWLMPGENVIHAMFVLAKRKKKAVMLYFHVQFVIRMLSLSGSLQHKIGGLQPVYNRNRQFKKLLKFT